MGGTVDTGRVVGVGVGGWVPHMGGTVGCVHYAGIIILSIIGTTMHV